MIGIILAAGFSRRMGQNKLLLPLGNQTILERVIKESKASKLKRVYLVYREAKVKELGLAYDVECIENKEAIEGQSTSIRVALSNIGDDWDSYMFLMGDQPLISHVFLDQLIESYKECKKSILVPCYQGQRGTPVIFGAIWKEKLLKLKGDQGGRKIIVENPQDVYEYVVSNYQVGQDIDIIEDYERLVGGGMKDDNGKGNGIN